MRRFGWIVHAWVLVINHFRLVVESTSEANPRDSEEFPCIAALERSYDRRAHRRRSPERTRMISQVKMEKAEDGWYVAERPAPPDVLLRGEMRRKLSRTSTKRSSAGFGPKIRKPQG